MYLRSLAIDESFIRKSSTTEYYHADVLGSVLALTDSTSAVQTTYKYGSFGQTIITGSSTNPFQYTGRENDGTGLYYYRARYYSPSLERFVSPDPLLCGASGQFPLRSAMRNSQTVNAFAYVVNSPINLRDPLGLSPECEYYDNRCEEVGGAYYCTVARFMCEETPREPIINCYRLCLQMVDYQCTKIFGRKQTGESCAVVSHASCIVSCTFGFPTYLGGGAGR